MRKNCEKELTDLLKSFNERITALEQRLSEPRPFYQSIKQPSHYLESNNKLMTDTGLTTETTVPICTICHSTIGDKYFICHHCDRVLCETCTIIHNNRAHCEQCLRIHHLDVSKRDYLILLCISNGITEKEKINELTAILDEEIERSFIKLQMTNLIKVEKRLFGLLRETKVTDDGAIAINTYRQVYGRHEDVVTFGRALRTYISEKLR